MTAFLGPFVHAALLLDRFVAHVLLIAAMRLCLVLEHIALGPIANAPLGVGGLILEAGECVAIALLVLRSLKSEAPPPCRLKRRKRAASRRPRWSAVRRRRGTRTCTCRSRKRKK
jgi:hypothetical protein